MKLYSPTVTVDKPHDPWRAVGLGTGDGIELMGQISLGSRAMSHGASPSGQISPGGAAQDVRHSQYHFQPQH